MALRALALNCTLSPSPADSSTDRLLGEVLAELSRHGVEHESVRVVDHDVRPGVELDMGEGDVWPAIREKVMAADILVLGTPTWMGQQSSVCQRVLERLDVLEVSAESAEQLRVLARKVDDLRFADAPGDS